MNSDCVGTWLLSRAAAEGIGPAVVPRLVDEGAKVAFCARETCLTPHRRKSLQRVVKQTARAHGDVPFCFLERLWLRLTADA